MISKKFVSEHKNLENYYTKGDILGQQVRPKS